MHGIAVLRKTLVANQASMWRDHLRIVATIVQPFFRTATRIHVVAKANKSFLLHQVKFEIQRLVALRGNFLLLFNLWLLLWFTKAVRQIAIHERR